MKLVCSYSRMLPEVETTSESNQKLKKIQNITVTLGYSFWSHIVYWIIYLMYQQVKKQFCLLTFNNKLTK
jgi:hypothetical protein